MAPPREGTAPSAARHLQPYEADDLKAIALGLPDDWQVAVRPPHGQLAIEPIKTAQRDAYCWAASRQWGAVRRQRLRRARP